MAFYLLVTITTVLLFTLLGLSFLLFGREWLRAKREGKFARDLGRHEGLITRLRVTSPDEFQMAFRQLAVVPDPDMREYVGTGRETVCEDMEIIVRLQRYIKEKRLSCRVGYTPEPLCWTEGPETFRTLGMHRNRWMRGLMETLSYHRAILLNPKYGILGWFAFPFFVLFELLGGPLEFLGYDAVPILFALGLLSSQFLFLFFTLSVTYGALVSVSSVVTGAWSERTRRYREQGSSLLHYRDRRHIAVLLAYALLENLGYRQITLWWRIRGIWDYYFGKKGWEKFERKGFKEAPAHPAKEAG